MSPSPGEVIGGKYRLMRLIGDGGMGVVFEAQHQVLQVPVALKFLHAELAKRQGLASRFLQEARVSASIQSPHVAHVTDVDTAFDGSPYLVMELLHGESLQTLLDRVGRLSRDMAIDFGLQILAGLEAAHALNVVHRDLKPDNVFVTPSSGGPLLKLIDFGIAKLRASTEYQRGLTRAGALMGTPEYMAPEQLFAAENVDHRADLYSLGVMLFEMLTGRRPADGDDAQAIVGKVMAGNVLRLAELDPQLPEGLVRLIECATAPERNARFESAVQMRIALSEFAGALSHAGRMASSPPGPMPSSAPYVGGTSVSAYAPTSEAPPARRLPKTLPPDDAAEAAGDPNKGATQPVSPELVQQMLRTGQMPEQRAAFPSNSTFQAPTLAKPKRRGKTLITVLVVLLGAIVTTAAVAFVAIYRSGRDIDGGLVPTATPIAPPETTVAPLNGGATPANTSVQTSPQNPTTVPPTTKPGTTKPGTTAPTTSSTPDGGTTTSPFPFPIPSTFPPLPSTFPAIPSTLPPLPSTIPTAFPGIPGLPGFPGQTAPAADAGK
jgi:serine/threonine-protein kinase